MAISADCRNWTLVQKTPGRIPSPWVTHTSASAGYDSRSRTVFAKTKGELMADDSANGDPNLLELATDLTIAWLSNPNTRASAEEVPAFLQTMHGAVSGLAAPGTPSEEPASETPEFTPAVSVRKSLASNDHIISMIDGKPYKTLKRHLSTHGLTPAQYRERYRLKADYPMVAENYGAMRRDMAKRIGLGRKPGAAVKPQAAKPAPAAKTTAKQKPARQTAAKKPHGATQAAPQPMAATTSEA